MLTPEETSSMLSTFREEFDALNRGRRQGLREGMRKGERKGERKGVLKGVIEVAVDVLGQVEVDAVLASTPVEQQAERLRALIQARLQG